MNINIKVIGVGGAGINVINRLKEREIDYRMMAVHTDEKALELARADEGILIGSRILKGNGSKGYSQLVEQAVEESRQAIVEAIKDVDVAVVIFGAAGGTGGGAGYKIAEMADERGILTISFIMEPFRYEANDKVEQSKKCIGKFEKNRFSFVTIDSNRLLDMVDRETPLNVAIKKGDEPIIDFLEKIKEMTTKEEIEDYIGSLRRLEA